MSIALAFWILMLVWAVFGLAWHGGFVAGYGPLGGSLLLFFLLLLIGWKVFGAPLHG